MNRLTVNGLNRTCYDPWELCGMDSYCTKDCHEEGGCAEGCEILKMYKKLAEYEDLEEQGLLLKLPCKVGDTLYRIDTDEEIENAEIENCTIENIVICENGEIIFKYDAYDGVICYLENIITGKPYLDFYKVFLTQAKAEEALKKMKSGE